MRAVELIANCYLLSLVGPVGFELEAFWWRLSHQPKS
jgi:hypothetical protein